MKRKNSTVIQLLIIVAVLVVTSGCGSSPPAVSVGPLQTESTSVDLGDAEAVQVEINMGAGQLDVAGGADGLLEADFAYNVAEMKPEVSYGDGTLTVAHPDVSVGIRSLWDLDDYRSEWNLRLNDDVPMEMRVDMGAGTAAIDLGTLALTSLDMNTGAGEVAVDLSGAASLTALNIEMGAGELSIDLSGDWQDDLDAVVKGGAGSMTLQLPRDVGVRVVADTGLGPINASGLNQDGDVYTNDAYDASAVALRIDVEGGIGEINLELAESSVMAEEETADQTESIFDEQLASQLQSALEAAVASPDTNWSGAVLHVSSPEFGTWTGAAGLGDPETNTAMRPHDKFRAGSLTKPFIAVVVLQLVEEGLFALDDTVTTILPERVTDQFVDSDKITVRMLLNHSTGLPDFMDTAGPEIIGNLDKVWQPEELLDFAAAQEPWFAPGEGQAYSNTDYTLLGMIIEEASGRPWREEMRARIFEPLHLENTFLPEPDDATIPGDFAHGYADLGSGPMDMSEAANASVVGAAGGVTLVTNAEDMTRFVNAVAANQLFQESDSLGEMLTVLNMMADTPLGDIVQGYSLGLMHIDFGGGIMGIGHSGDTPGYNTFVFHLPAQNMTISGAVNADDFQAGFVQLIPRALEVLAPGYAMAEPPAPDANNSDESDLTLKPLNDERLDEFTSYIEESMAQWRIPGAAVAVVQYGEIVYAEGFGVRELGQDVPVTPDTLFGIGSLSKSINAMLVATLVDEGFLEWDTPAVDIWPDFQLADPDATATVTVRDLLSQRTGMERDESLLQGKNLSPEELMVALAQLPVTSQPGTQHTYENVGVATAGFLGALAAGGEFGSLFDAYAGLMQAQVFGPIGMANSTVDIEAMNAHLEGARGHMWNEAGQLVPQNDFFDDTVPGEGIIPAGGVAASANDMARYLITHLNRGVSPAGERAVSAENLTETWAPQISIGPDAFTDRVYLPSSAYNPADSQLDYGMGWFAGTYNGVSVVTHPGNQQGWTAQMALLPEADTGVVILTNAETLPCAAPMILGVQYRLIELRYGLDNQIDGYVEQAMDTVRETFGMECLAPGEVSTSAQPDPSQSELSAELSAALQGLVDAQVQEQDILGMAMAVRSMDGTVIGAGSGYSDPAGENAWTVDTQSAIGSVTKSFTAVVIAQLIEEGKLSLDDTIDIWFPDQPNGDKITVRMLLSHTSGLAKYINGPAHVDEMQAGKFAPEWAPLDLVAEANEAGPVDEPGSSDAHYANTNFVLLGLITEAITGNSWAQEVEARIIQPLDLQNTTFLSADGIQDTMVGGYAKTADGYQNLLDESWYPHASTVWSAGEIVATAADLMTFAAALFDGDLVSSETLAVMAQPLGTDPDSGIMWGFGGGTIEGLPPGAFGMGGDIPGASAFYMGVLDTKLVAVALVNSQGGDAIAPSIAALEYLNSLQSGAQEPAVATEIQAPDYQKIIDEVLQDDRPAIALRVTTPEFEVFETRGYADWENEIPLEKDHLFRIASVTKTFIATLALTLHAEGKLNLDETITSYLPESMTSHIQYADQITIRQLLNHTSGVFDTSDNPEFWTAQFENPTKEWTDAEVLEFAYDQPAYFEPGTSFAYSNTNYQLTGLILDEVLGRHHSEELRSRILDPLGLSSTFYEQHEEFDRNKLAHGYFDFDGDGIAEDYYDLRIETGHADGGLISTVEDMEGFITALFKNDDFPDAGTKEQFLQELMTFQPVASQDPTELGSGPGIAEYDYGYGKGYGHSGGTPGYVANMIHFPDHDVTLTLTWNGFDGGFESMGAVPIMIDSLIEATFSALGHEKAVGEDDAAAGNVYEDPQGRFSMPLVGDWTQVETDGSYGHVMSAEPPLDLYIVSVESDDTEADIEAGAEAALQQIGIDPAALTETDRGSFGKWNIVYYSLADDQGAIVLAQIDDGTTHVVIVSGDFAHTSSPSDNLVRTVGGFELSGEVVLPTTVDEFETFVNGVVGEIPPGLSIAIALGEDVTYANGFGTADGPRELAATPETVFQWGSVAKIATATAIMQLYEQGLVDLDAPVSDYLDYFPADIPVTIRHLLNHSSGIPESPEFTIINIGLDGQPLPDPDLADRATYEEVSSTIFEPGSTSAYSNLNYLTLGQIVAQVSGQPYIEYVQDHILAPLGMENTDFSYSSEAMITNAAAGAIPAGAAEGLVAAIDGIRGDGADFIRENDETHAWLNRFNVMAAHGGLSGPATELIRFLQMHLNGGELDGVRILSSESAALMQEMQLSNADAPLGYGLGWEIFEDGEHLYVEHPGGGEGLQALTRLYPNEGFAVVLLSNATGYDHVGVVDAAANVVFTMLGAGATTSEPPAASEENVYTDPQDRFSMPLVGEWTPVESTDAFAHFTQTEPSIDMYVVTTDSTDVDAGIEATLTEIDIDSSTLTLLDAGGFGQWTLLFYELDAEHGVAVLAQVRGDTTYSLIFTGNSGVTRRPPSTVMETIEGVAFADEGDGAALPATVEEFEAYANNLVEEMPPGLSIVIAANGAVAYANGFGMADGPLDMAATPDTVYPWASMAKIATATAIMQLYEQGRLDLDAPVADYLDYFPAEYPITIRQLLDHTAGLSDPLELVFQKFNLDGEPKPDPDEAARTYYAQFDGPMFEPGSGLAYANMNFLTLGEIVAAISGQSYIEYVRTHILDPLGMTQTDFTYSEAMIANAAAGAIPAAQTENMVSALDQARGLGDGADFIRETGEEFTWMNRYNIFAPWGGLIGPATDVMRFAQMHLNGGELDGVRVLSPESVALMQEMQLSTAGDPLGHGLGWEIPKAAERLSVQHSGSGGGVQALMRLYPNEGVAVVLMSNAVGYQEEEVVDAAANVLFSLLGTGGE